MAAHLHIRIQVRVERAHQRKRTTCVLHAGSTMQRGSDKALCNAHVPSTTRRPRTCATLIIAGAPQLPALQRRACCRGRRRWCRCGRGLCRRCCCRCCRAVVWQLAKLHQMAQLLLRILLALCCRQLPELVIEVAPEPQGSQRVPGKRVRWSVGERWRQGGGDVSKTSAPSRERSILHSGMMFEAPYLISKVPDWKGTRRPPPASRSKCASPKRPRVSTLSQDMLL